MYIAFVTPAIDFGDGDQTIDLKTMAVENRIFVRLRIWRTGQHITKNV